MCLAAPGKIVSIDTSNPDLRMAKVDFGGIIKDICIEWLPEAEIGSYILAHVGTALSVVDETDALESIRTINEIGDLLEKEDDTNKITD
ncbi:MAG: HypC/HybG/HupF family hydrogenase formation chaperone [Bacteroidales bacterium]|nr:HypC/HybG/HupF family hydrogenase formation chaperone [Bacteroidales bacterium]